MLRKHNLFEETLRKKLENQVAEPPANAWKKIHDELNNQSLRRSGYRSIVASILFLLLFSGGAVLYFSSKLTALEEKLSATRNELSDARKELTSLKSSQSKKTRNREETEKNDRPNGFIPRIPFFAVSHASPDHEKSFFSEFQDLGNAPVFRYKYPNNLIAFTDPSAKQKSIDSVTASPAQIDDKEDEDQSEKSFWLYGGAGKSNLLVMPNMEDQLLISGFNGSNAYYAEIGARYLICDGGKLDIFAGGGLSFNRNDYTFQASTNEVDYYEISSSQNTFHLNTVYKSLDISSQNWSLDLKPEIGLVYQSGHSGKWRALASLAYLRSLIRKNQYLIEGNRITNSHLRNENLALSIGLFRNYLIRNKANLSVGPTFSGYFVPITNQNSPVILNNYSAGLSLLYEVR